jgi:hypothetical protein
MKQCAVFPKSLLSIMFISMFLLVFPINAQQKYDLTFNWEVGEKYSYNTYVTGNVISSDENEGTDIKVEYLDEWEIASLDLNKEFYNIIQKNVDHKGEKFPLRPYGYPTEGESVSRMVDIYGRISGVDHYHKGSRYYLFPLVFPQVPIPVDGKWTLTQDVKVPLFETYIEVPFKIVYTFEEIHKNYKHRGHDCARIRVDVKYEKENEAGNRGVTGLIKTRIYFDLVDKKIVDYETTDTRREYYLSKGRKKITSVKITSISK